MTTIRHQSEGSDLLEDTIPETVVSLAGFEALSDTTPAPQPALASGLGWNCLEHVPAASLASWIAECLRFGGRRPRQEVARAAYDARWAGHGVGARGDEPWVAPEIAIEIGPAVELPRPVSTTND